MAVARHMTGGSGSPGPPAIPTAIKPSGQSGYELCPNGPWAGAPDCCCIDLAGALRPSLVIRNEAGSASRYVGYPGCVGQCTPGGA